MFEGPIGKKMMIKQGYVPATCTLHEDFAGPLVWTEVNAGRDPCAGCSANRRECGGRPNRELSNLTPFGAQLRTAMRREDEVDVQTGDLPSPWEKIK